MKKSCVIGEPTDLGRRFLAAEGISNFLSIWLNSRLLPPAEQRVLEAYYASFRRHFSVRMRRFYDSQTREIMVLLAAEPGLRLLEIGCGCGSESLWFALHGAEVTALDLKSDRIAVAEKRSEVLEREAGQRIACTFRRVSLFDFPEDEAFDVVWMEQSFHHLEPREAVIDRVSAVLRPGGYLIVSEANALNPLLQVQLALRRGFRTITIYEDEKGRSHPYGNERILSAAKLRQAFAKRGVTCQSIRHFRVFPNYPIFDGLTWLENQLSYNCFVPVTTHFNYVGRKNG